MEISKLVGIRDNLLTVLRDIELLHTDLHKSEWVDNTGRLEFIETLKSVESNLKGQLDKCRVQIDLHLKETQARCVHDHFIEIITGDRVIYKCVHCGYLTDKLPAGAIIDNKEEKI